MAKFKLEIETDNATFDGDHNRDAEVARILRDIASKIELGYGGRLIYDINGNKVGRCDHED